MTVMTTEVLGLPRGRALTRDDLDSMPDDGHRYELIDGILIVSPAPRIVHQRVAAALFRAIDPVLPSPLIVLFAPLDVVLSQDTVLQPDLLIAPWDAFTERDLPGPPVLAVEVLSPSTRSVDLLLKKDRLCRAECRHYWVVDPDGPSITAWVLRDGGYQVAGTASGDEELSLTEPFEVSIVPSLLVR
ncbi:Uma2 family endonuclease [Gordonia sp. X0973]|uniref:Uma2 family endonuclease n=1 Tax=Gordonia sp. X0973 TaxID=2742602 RepID=UPI000F527F33|nr:Uma2 family endonuclease [Gordonia sp. X0973]QKT08752.1 Uma2 family endonuclease [Gordonia sp. X0973]